MIDGYPALRHDLFQIPVAERVGQIPPHAGENDILFETMAFKVAHLMQQNLLEGRRREASPYPDFNSGMFLLRSRLRPFGRFSFVSSVPNYRHCQGEY